MELETLKYVSSGYGRYQVLTKRSARMRDLLSERLRVAAAQRHIWWGVSVENRRHGLPRVEHLRSAPARVRFLSVEPLLEDLGQLDLSGFHWVIVNTAPSRAPESGVHLHRCLFRNSSERSHACFAAVAL